METIIMLPQKGWRFGQHLFWTSIFVRVSTGCQGVTLQDVIPKDRLDTLKQADRVKRRALYVAACAWAAASVLRSRGEIWASRAVLGNSDCVEAIGGRFQAPGPEA